MPTMSMTQTLRLMRAAVTALAAATAGTTTQPRPDAATDVPAVPITAGELADHPGRYFDRVVIVRADVEDVYSPTVFTLDEDRLWSTGEDVLVIADGLDRAIAEDMDVTVVGTVMPYREDVIRRRLAGYAPAVTAGLLSAFGRRPIVVARSIRNVFGEELLPEPPRGTDAAVPPPAGGGAARTRR
jgi:hypothetical protein